MYRFFKYLGYTLFLPLWWLQLLVPRKKNLWVFGAWYGDRYSDNSMYLFEYINNNHKIINAVWITKNRAVCKHVTNLGHRCFMASSLWGAYYCLRAKYVIISSIKRDVNALWINGATTVQLWHGNPMKKIGLDDSYAESKDLMYQIFVRHIFKMAYEFNYDYVVSNAPVFTDKMASAFGASIDRIIETGCPRNDIFFSDKVAATNLEIRARFKDCKLVYYLPTFRARGQKQSLFDLEGYDESRLQSFLEEENMVMVTKAHFAANPWERNDTVNDRILHLPPDDLVDVNFLLKDADMLITDYSGAYFDFLLTERPIVFAAFDLQEYMEASRELYFVYSDAVAGPIVINWDELLECLRSVWEDQEYRDLVMDKNKIFNKYHDGDNSKRVYESITAHTK